MMKIDFSTVSNTIFHVLKNSFIFSTFSAREVYFLEYPFKRLCFTLVAQLMVTGVHLKNSSSCH